MHSSDSASILCLPRADILILPLGRSQPSRQINLAVRQAMAADIQIYAAAGNVGFDRILFPAILPQVIAVTRADLNGKILQDCSQLESVDYLLLYINISIFHLP